MNTRLLCAALCFASLSACAQNPALPKAADVRPEVAPRAAELDAATVYQFLLGEIAGQRGDLVLATEAYADLAQRTRDPSIVRRAVEIALYSRRTAEADKLARLWVAVEPDSARARQTLASLLISTGRLDEAKPQFQALLALPGQDVAEDFSRIHAHLSRHPNKQAVLSVMRELAAPFATVPEARLAVAQAAYGAVQRDMALAELDAALSLRAGWEEAALLRGEVLRRDDEDGAAMRAYWSTFLSQYPSAGKVRLAMARALVKAERFTEARQEFERLLQGTPGNPETRFAVGLLAMQLDDLDAAEDHLKQALDLGYPDSGVVRLYLGRISEARKDLDAALAWYRGVSRGDALFEARLRTAALLGKLNRPDEGLDILKDASATDKDEQTRLYQTRAGLLMDARRLDDAYALLSQALKELPGMADLQYDRAMVAEKIGKLDVMEQDLRALIKLQPDHAHAYNALGYTLADRTSRLDEAMALIEQALKLAPDDPFIQDSMGWALFKAGRTEEAIAYLRKAYAAKPDPEIAAHLGEVLWRQGSQDEARGIWLGASKAHPDNEVLRETLSRFQP